MIFHSSDVRFHLKDGCELAKSWQHLVGSVLETFNGFLYQIKTFLGFGLILLVSPGFRYFLMWETISRDLKIQLAEFVADTERTPMWISKGVVNQLFALAFWMDGCFLMMPISERVFSFRFTGLRKKRHLDLLLLCRQTQWNFLQVGSSLSNGHKNLYLTSISASYCVLVFRMPSLTLSAHYDLMRRVWE